MGSWTAGLGQRRDSIPHEQGISRPEIEDSRRLLELIDLSLINTVNEPQLKQEIRKLVKESWWRITVPPLNYSEKEKLFKKSRTRSSDWDPSNLHERSLYLRHLSIPINKSTWNDTERWN